MLPSEKVVGLLADHGIEIKETNLEHQDQETPADIVRTPKGPSKAVQEFLDGLFKK